MNSYEILRPAGEGTGIWACGKCNQIHFLASQGLGGASEINKARADDCCAPKNCRYCGRPTEPGPEAQEISSRNWSASKSGAGSSEIKRRNWKTLKKA